MFYRLLTIINKFFLFFILVFGFCNQGIAAPQNPQPQTLLSALEIDRTFERASLAFETGDFNTAANHFRALMETEFAVEARYNLAICLFKLKQWSKAQELFLLLQGEQPEEELITYNLAITEKKLGRTSLAVANFRLLAQYANDDSIKELSRRQLKVLGATTDDFKKTSSQSAPSTSSLVLGAKIDIGAYDKLLSPEDETDTGIRDQLSESRGYFKWQQHNNGNRLVINGLLYHSQYQKTQQYNANLGQLASKFYLSDDKGFWLAGLKVNRSELDGHGYLQNSSLELGRIQAMGSNSQISFAIRHQDIRSLNEQFNPFDGDKQQLQLSYKYRLETSTQWTHSAGLSLLAETNARQDQETSNEFRSYSPKRHELSVTWLAQRQNWRIAVDASYRNSDYQQPNIYGRQLHIKRHDQRSRMSLGSYWKPSPSWTIGAQVQHLNNQSNIGSYDYQQTLLKLSIGWEG